MNRPVNAVQFKSIKEGKSKISSSISIFILPEVIHERKNTVRRFKVGNAYFFSPFRITRNTLRIFQYDQSGYFNGF